MSSGGTLTRGIVAGFIAATVVVLWFLAVDALTGRAFYTPAFLAAMLTGGGTGAIEPDASAIALFTLVHYAVFMLLGMVVAWILDRARIAAGLFVGIIAGFLLFDLVFYAAVLTTGVDVVDVLGWPQVLLGNLLAGVAMGTFLQWTSPVPQVGWRMFLDEHRTIREGILAGILGAVVVAVWFLIIDTALREPLFTPAALGSALFLGAGSADEVLITFQTVAGYTVLHVLLFLALGLIAGILANAIEHEQAMLLGAVLLIVTFGVFFYGLVAIIASWLLAELAWWSILIASVLAAGAVVAYLWRKHPRIAVLLRQDTVERPA